MNTGTDLFYAFTLLCFSDQKLRYIAPSLQMSLILIQHLQICLQLNPYLGGGHIYPFPYWLFVSNSERVNVVACQFETFSKSYSLETPMENLVLLTHLSPQMILDKN